MEERRDHTLMGAIAGSEEISIFETEVVKDAVDFKWETFAMASHRVNAVMHIIQVIIQRVYIAHVYLQVPTYYTQSMIDDHQPPITSFKVNERVNPPPNKQLLFCIGVCLLFPLRYDFVQLQRSGFRNYFAKGKNWLDVVHIGMGYYNIYLQMRQNSDGTYNTWELLEKLVMITVVVTSLMQTFFFMRIVGSFSYIVTMIQSVIWDLKVFMVFFFTLMVMLSAVLAVIFCPTADEYSKIGPFFGGIATTIRLSLGDFDFDILTKDVQDGGLNTKQHFLYWAVWMLIIIFSCMIFLNFIIAEVSSSY